jgi:predicted ATPase
VEAFASGNNEEGVVVPVDPTLPRGRLTQLRISGLRVIKDLTIDLQGLTVLIGDNGTGKSSILEALELLRMASKPVSYALDVLEKKHGRYLSMQRRESSSMHLGCRVEVNGGAHQGLAIDYDFEAASAGGHALIVSESCQQYLQPPRSQRVPVLARSSATDIEGVLRLATRQTGASSPPTENQPLEFVGGYSTGHRVGIPLGHLSITHPEAARVPSIRDLTAALDSIELHVPFETRPQWQQTELDLRASPRMPTTIEPTTRLARYALNLANAFQELRNRGGATWQRVVERARLGIREDLRDFRISPYGRGQVELEVVFGNAPDRPMPVEYLSEGQLAYLAMVALCELSDQSSVLAFDEPEVHLHPGLLARVVFMLEELSKTVPVILSTHSDRLLDCLSDPAASVVLCDLDEEGATRLRRPNKEALDKWLQDYRGVGSLRAEGYTEQLFDEPDAEEQDSTP